MEFLDPLTNIAQRVGTTELLKDKKVKVTRIGCRAVHSTQWNQMAWYCTAHNRKKKQIERILVQTPDWWNKKTEVLSILSELVPELICSPPSLSCVTVTQTHTHHIHICITYSKPHES